MFSELSLTKILRRENILILEIFLIMLLKYIWKRSVVEIFENEERQSILVRGKRL